MRGRRGCTYPHSLLGQWGEVGVVGVGMLVIFLLGDQRHYRHPDTRSGKSVGQL